MTTGRINQVTILHRAVKWLDAGSSKNFEIELVEAGLGGLTSYAHDARPSVGVCLGPRMLYIFFLTTDDEPEVRQKNLRACASTIPKILLHP